MDIEMEDTRILWSLVNSHVACARLERVRRLNRPRTCRLQRWFLVSSQKSGGKDVFSGGCGIFAKPSRLSVVIHAIIYLWYVSKGFFPKSGWQAMATKGVDRIHVVINMWRAHESLVRFIVQCPSGAR
jgi:hypothetical protein